MIEPYLASTYLHHISYWLPKSMMVVFSVHRMNMHETSTETGRLQVPPKDQFLQQRDVKISGVGVETLVGDYLGWTRNLVGTNQLVD